MKGHDIIDPIDELIPPSRPWWVRLFVGVAIVSVMGLGAALWGFGYVFPQPDCCGSTSGSAEMSLTADGTAVTVTALIFNSSGRDLRISRATADLPGARVLGIAMLDESNSTFPISRTEPLPAVVGARTLRRLVITFVPTTCEDEPEPWGSVAVHLDVVNESWPSFGRTYTIPDPVVDQGHSVWSPDAAINATSTTPLAAACALLGRSSN
ncbi:MAG: hypothetical protein FD127_3394 [Acidimicrobiaceae bacterium]|nr:MAG: hypothetical protein FD127_3394 [Acidimicrobiaceae bacterium]